MREKRKIYPLKLTKAERASLDFVCEELKLQKATLIRTLIKNAEDKLRFYDKKPIKDYGVKV